MRRSVSIVPLVCLASFLTAPTSFATTIGNFCSITDANQLPRGNQQASFRPLPKSGAGTAASPFSETWFAFVTFNGNPGYESVGEIWQGRNFCSAYSSLQPLDARRPILQDSTGIVSYIDPAWSSDGKWLAYVQTDNLATLSSIYVRQYVTSTNSLTAVTPLGGPILVANGSGGIHHRHPAWEPGGTQIAYDSDASGLSIDLWTVNVSLDATAHTGTVDELSRVRHTSNDLKTENKPAYSPDGSKLAFVTNLFGPKVIQILTVADNLVTLAELNFAMISHDNPAWSNDGLSLYYDAPSSEDPSNPLDIWRLDMATAQKSELNCSLAGADPDVSKYANVTAGGTVFNYIAITSSAAGLGLNIWRGTGVPNRPPLVSAGGPYVGPVGDPVNFNGTGSSDPESGQLAFTWDFGDGTPGTGQTPAHIYTSAGVFPVSLDVVDSGCPPLHATGSTVAKISEVLTTGPCSP